MTLGEQVYIPEYSLQGQEVSGHVTWNRDSKISLGIELPEGIEVKEFYNVVKNGSISSLVSR